MCGGGGGARVYYSYTGNAEAADEAEAADAQKS